MQIKPRPMPILKLETKLVYQTGEKIVNPVISPSQTQWRKNSYLNQKGKKAKKTGDGLFRGILDRIMKNWEALVLVVSFFYFAGQVIRVLI